MQISQGSQIVVSHLYFHFQLDFDKSTLLIDSIQWLFSAVCLVLNAGEETATSNRNSPGHLIANTHGNFNATN